MADEKDPKEEINETEEPETSTLGSTEGPGKSDGDDPGSTEGPGH